jgi:hypothetical protein
MNVSFDETSYPALLLVKRSIHRRGPQAGLECKIAKGKKVYETPVHCSGGTFMKRLKQDLHFARIQVEFNDGASKIPACILMPHKIVTAAVINRIGLS